MNATNAYVYVRSIEGLAPGFYEYSPEEQAIALVKPTKLTLGEMMNGQHFSDLAAFALLFTCRLDRLWWKYSHSRAYRMALIELGHHSQTALITISALGLKSWLTGALDDSRLESELEIAGTNEYIFFCVAGGHGSDSSLSPHLLNRLVLNEQQTNQ